MRFNQDYPSAKQVVLIRNYRSCQNILDQAYNFIQGNNPHRLEYVAHIDKHLLAVRAGEGVIKHLHFKNIEQEVQGTVNEIIRLVKENKNLNFADFAILLRANDSAAAFVRACERSGVPAYFAALKGLYFKPVVQDIIAYLKFLNNYQDSTAAWRVINMPFLAIPNSDIAKIVQYGHKKSQSIGETLNEINAVEGLTKQGAQSIAELMGLAVKHSNLIRGKTVSELVLAFLQESGYLEHLVRQDRRQEIDFIGQFYNKIKDYEAANIDPNLKNLLKN